ncbi:MAG: PEGA domain-containing protein, partial [Actinomycetota bacterium]
YYPYSYGYGSGYGSYGYRQTYRETSSLRLLVEPSETRVYVDGYYAGVVDDFDGIFQRLHVSPGRHEIALKLEGYRSYRVKLYAPVGHTIKIRRDLVKGTGEDTEEMPGDRAEAYDERRPAATEDEDDDPAEAPAGRSADQGTLRLSIRPEDASVYVDGEFRGTARQARTVALAPGRHRVEVVRPGYRTFDRDVEVRAGRTADVDVELERPY